MNANELRELFHQKKERIEPSFSAITAKLSEGISLYGYGFVGKWAFDFLNSLGADVRFIVDNDKNKHGTFVDNTPVLSSSQADYSNVCGIVIGSRHAANVIASTLQDLAIPVMSIDAFAVCYYSSTHLERLEELFLHDNSSLEVLYSVLLAMLTGDNHFLRGNISFNPFFSEFPFFNCDGEIYLDAGAYVGDTFERFIWSVNGMFKKAYLFEPGPTQYNSMLLRVDRLCNEWSIEPQKIKCENLILGDSCRVVEFYQSVNPIQSQQVSSSLDRDLNQSRVFCANKVSLDSYFKNLSCLPSIIKVDIEGSETELLNGGKDLISATKPKIALSIYHYPSDIFLLPLKVARMDLAYTLSIRHHSCMLMDTLLYCF